MDDRFFKNTEMIREILAGVSVTVEEALQNFDANMEALNRLAAPEPELIQGYTSEQWQGVIDGGYLCEFLTDHSSSTYFDELKAIGPDGRYVSMNRGRCHSKCRPTQIKGVMRPIFVEPDNVGATYHFYKKARSVTQGTWNARLEFAKNDGADRYIEL